MKLHTTLSVFCLAVLCLSQASATERRFALSYETTTSPQGTLEYEQHFIWENGIGNDAFKFRQELEYGVTDRLQLGFYLYDFEISRGRDSRDAKWAGSGIEAIYQLTDPNKDGFGSALYGEVMMNDRDFALEGKLLLQKNFGPLMLVYNGIVEAEWEDHYSHQVGVLEQTLGLSYQFHPSFALGMEARYEVELDEWRHSEGNSVAVGPNLAYRKGSFFAAVTALFRVSDQPGEPNLELRTVMGFHF